MDFKVTINDRRSKEGGQTIVLVAASMVAFMAMAALAIDVVALYIARNEARRAADAAALAGAKVFVTSGYTSYPAGFANTGLLCNNGSGLADQQAIQAASANNVSGGTPSTITTSCNFSNPENPRMTVQVQQTNLPIFFSKIWSRNVLTVTASATAEAYNASYNGTNGPPIQVSGVKPWLVANCPPNPSSTGSNSNCSSTQYFIDQATGGIANNGTFLGQPITLVQAARPTFTTPLPPAQYLYYPLRVPIVNGSGASTVSCPSSTVSSQCGTLPSGTRHKDNIACFNSFQFSCSAMSVGPGQTVLVDRFMSSAGYQSTTISATECLIHADGPGSTQGQDVFTWQGLGQPALIAPGINNPDAGIRSSSSISRSDSIVAVPLYDGRNLCNTSGTGACGVNAPIIGFLQIAILQIDSSTDQIDAIILNAVGCNPSATGTPVSGGDVSLIPVRLVQ